MDRLASLEVIVAIVDYGGFGRAAERLGLSATMVSTHLARLEDRLGARLINRSTRRFALTPQGHRFVEDARAILAAIGEAESLARRGAAGPSGRVSIDLPFGLGERFVLPAIPLFRARHPRIALDLSVGDRGTIPHAEGFDMIVRVGVETEGRGVSLPLADTRYVQVAAPAYLAARGVPSTPGELHDHDLIVYASVERPIGYWRFAREGERRSMRPKGVITLNHGGAIRDAALAGMGIAQTLHLLVARELAAGTLVPVLTDWNTTPVAVRLLLPPGRLDRPAVRAVSEFLQTLDWGKT